MKLAFGFKAHTGWAALVVVGAQRGAIQVLDRRRMELVPKGSPYAKQPFHAAEKLAAAEAAALVERSVALARTTAAQEMTAAVARARDAGHDVVACGVLVGKPMPPWSVEEIRAVHFRMHKAEGVMFKDVLARAAETCGLNLVAILEQELMAQAGRLLQKPAAGVTRHLAALGKTLGAPWALDQKEAALAAMIALRARIAN